MKKYLLLFLVFPFLVASAPHKFYVSITKIEYVQEKQSIQIITKIFTDDIEKALKQQYKPSISIGTKKETEEDTEYLKSYILEHLKISVNGKPTNLKYIGQEYDLDMVNAYIEITNVKDLTTIKVEDKMLFDVFEDQQNIIHLKTPTTRRSLILEKDNPNGVLNFE